MAHLRREVSVRSRLASAAAKTLIFNRPVFGQFSGPRKVASFMTM